MLSVFLAEERAAVKSPERELGIEIAFTTPAGDWRSSKPGQLVT